MSGDATAARFAAIQVELAELARTLRQMSAALAALVELEERRDCPPAAGRHLRPVD